MIHVKVSLIIAFINYQYCFPFAEYRFETNREVNMHVVFMSYNTDDANVMRSFDVNRMPKRDKNKT